MTPTDLKSAGLSEEADRLAAAIRQASIWNPGISSTALALSVFGSRRYEELAAALSRRSNLGGAA